MHSCQRTSIVGTEFHFVTTGSCNIL